VAQSGTAPSISELRASLKKKLPEYMIPSGLIFLDKLPLTPNGKLDRQALPKPDRSRSDDAESFVPPRTAAEEKLAGIWAGVLGIERVGIHDNFFELGGDSILSIQIVAQARLAGWQLTPKMLFDHQTVASAGNTGARKLRQAISIAIDTEESISIFRNGRGIAAQGPIPPGIFGYREGEAGINRYMYDWVNGQPQRKSIESGAATSVWAAQSPGSPAQARCCSPFPAGSHPDFATVF
jgi:aryl carrier-like protein